MSSIHVTVRAALAVLLACPLAACSAPAPSDGASSSDARPAGTRYETRAVRDPDGTDRFYMGRQIALVMGPGGSAWLERPERETEERPQLVIDALGLAGDETVADLGAGSGYFAFRIAKRLPRGRVLAVDVAPEMLAIVRRRAEVTGVANVVPVQATEQDPGLTPGSVDVVLMVDVYHELYWPYEVMTRVHAALKPGGRLVLVEYRANDPEVPIRATHTMTEAQIRREMAAVGFRHVRTIPGLPWQHLVVFERNPER